MTWEEGDRAYVDTKPGNHGAGKHYFAGHYWGMITVLEVAGNVALIEGKISWGHKKRAHIPVGFLRSAGDPKLTHLHARALYSLYIPRFGTLPDARLAAWNLKDIPENVIHDILMMGLAERVPVGPCGVKAVVITLAGKLELRRYLSGHYSPST